MMRKDTSSSAEAVALVELLKDGLMSSDASWEDDAGGHDWAEWCVRARTAIDSFSATTPETVEETTAQAAERRER